MSTIRAKTQLLKSRDRAAEKLVALAIQKQDAHDAVDEKFAGKETDLKAELDGINRVITAMEEMEPKPMIEHIAGQVVDGPRPPRKTS